MVPDTEPKAIAARLRGIFGGQDGGDAGATARRLMVSEVALRMSIDPDEPHPTLEILAAVVAYYGVDPAWLVTGAYDAATHRAAMGEEARATRADLLSLIAKQLVRESPSAPTQPEFRLEA